MYLETASVQLAKLGWHRQRKSLHHLSPTHPVYAYTERGQLQPLFLPEPRPAHAPQVYVLSVPADEGDGWVFPTATHPLILDLANHVAPGKVDSRHVTCAPRLLCEVLVRPLVLM